MTRRGFTIVELIITITIMGILLTLAVVNLNSTQARARDDERKTDVASINTYLDTFYSGGLSNTADIPTTTNRILNPSFEGGTTAGWGGYYGAPLALQNSGCIVGNRCVSVNISGGAYNGIVYITPGGATSPTNVPYVYSAFIKGPPGLVIDISGRPTTTAYGYEGEGYGQRNYTLTGNWQRISTDPATLLATTPVIGMQVRAKTASAAPIYIDGFMATQGNTLTSYYDGSQPEWAWNGTANASTSSGPMMISSLPGTYPNTIIASSHLIAPILVGADLKAFTAPGQSDPYASFIAATNNVETTAGVSPQPTINQYVYQPIDRTGQLCSSDECSRFNIFYRLESDNTVYKVSSKNQ